MQMKRKLMAMDIERLENTSPAVAMLGPLPGLEALGTFTCPETTDCCHTSDATCDCPETSGCPASYTCPSSDSCNCGTDSCNCGTNTCCCAPLACPPSVVGDLVARLTNGGGANVVEF